MARHRESDREAIVSETRQRLAEAAVEEFAREGFVGANINRISTSAGFSKGTIYNYFASKRALMLALIDEIAEAHVGFIIEQIQQEEDPFQQLERFFVAGFAWVTENLARARFMITTLYGPDVEFKLQMFEAYQPLFQFVSKQVIAEGIRRGVFRPVDPEATGALLMSIYLGTSSQPDEIGRIWLDPRQVAAFASHALRKPENPIAMEY